MLTIDKINMMAGSYDRLVEQNKSLQKELSELKEQNKNLQKLVREQEKRINELEAQKERGNKK